MKLGDKIKKLREEHGLTLKGMERIIKNNFPDNQALTMQGINKIEHNLVNPKTSTLLKICQVFDISYLELIKDTDYNQNAIIRKKDRQDSFIYNSKAKADIFTSLNYPFKFTEVTLLPLSQTSIEQSPLDGKEHNKLIYVISGKVKIILPDREINIGRGDVLKFNPTIKHYYKNISKAKLVVFVTITTPSHL